MRYIFIMGELMDLKSLNEKEKELLSQILQNTNLTRKRLSEILSLKNATLYRMIDSFILKGILMASKDTTSSTVGRPSDIIQANPSYGYFFSICIRRFSFRTALIDFNFRILLTNKFSCDASTSPEEVREQCYLSFQSMLAQKNLSEANILGIPITSFNTVTERHHPGFSWAGVPDIKKFFRQRFIHNPVFFGNGAISAACNCYYSVFFPKYKNIAYIILDEGIGIGYIIDKKIPRLSMRNVNALGHMIVDIHGPRCYCGQYGCLESLVNDFAIVKKTQDELKILQRGVLKDHIDDLNIMKICAAAEQQDAVACQVLEYAASVLSIGIENFLKIFQLEVIIISGKMVNNSPFFFQTLKNRLLIHHPPLIVEADDEEWANALKGTAEWYMSELLSHTPLPELIE